MGNPHAVIFEIPDQWQTYGEAIEKHPYFPRKTNVEFVRCLSPNQAEVKVWERGAGPTLACCTGACAVLVAGVLNPLNGHQRTNMFIWKVQLKKCFTQNWRRRFMNYGRCIAHKKFTTLSLCRN